MAQRRRPVDGGTGLYTDRVDPHGSGQYAFLWNGTAVYHYVGAWNGRYFAPIPEMGMSAKDTFVFVNSSEEVSYSFRAVAAALGDPHVAVRRVLRLRPVRALRRGQLAVLPVPAGVRARVGGGLGRPALERRLREEDKLAVPRQRVIDRWVPPGAKRPAAERPFPGG